MALTDAKVRQTKPGPKPIKLTDGDGLYLLITPAGTRSWRLRAQNGGRDTVRTIGAYPAMSLAEARRAADDARQAPVSLPEPAMSLRNAALAWHAVQKPRWRPHHAADVMESLEREIFPALGKRSLVEITTPMILAELSRVQARGAVEVAHRLKQRIAAVFDHATAAGTFTGSNPAAGLQRAMQPIVRQRHRPAMLDLNGARAMLARAEAIPAHPVTRLALRLLALTAVRPGELRAAEWVEFEGIGSADTLSAWTIPSARMKHTRERAAEQRDHVVPLATQAIEALAVLHRLTGRDTLLFPGSRPGKPLSENAIGYLLNRAGFAGRHVPHGWRATFSTVMNERFPADRAVIDLMLAHVPKDAVERAYNRARHTARRRELAQAWADLLLAGMAPAERLLALPRR